MFEKLKQLLKKKETEKAHGDPCPEPSVEENAPVDPPAAAPPVPPVTPDKKTTPRSSGKAKAAPKKGKHGISVLSTDEDLASLFQEEGPHDIPAPPKPKPAPRQTRPAPPPKKKQKNRNRNGILVLSDEKDLFGLMAEEAEREGDRIVPSALKREASEEVAPAKKVQRDRHGLPILEQGQIPASEESDEFAELLASSLSEKSGEVLLSEKVDKLEQARTLTVKERLKRYPAPQGQLDLHGYTAAKADQTAEHYVRRAFSVGTYTLRLIVGKGLHSEHGAVLPDTIADRMTTLKQEGIVLAWAWEKGKKSKSGSILVYLNNYDSSRHGR
ncbi:Smr/MutS family protein [Desulfoluna spongiiphila]|uniref:DNA-nicking endonuclease, Smr domain n=1 Tax=Desulfoluna spongiiphila TaxID=419481 RepID=A0A1G5CKI2_9BACT|nr:Smr/MutS family protein [Desulfoluna spongiiphila]SCY02770.1 DNA-nicking endonuclease, Smr domain [Desulfoluna spongiiphila]